MAAIKNIIFDLGGVIMNIDFKKTEAAFAALGFTDFSAYMTREHITPLFAAYEAGNIHDTDFIKGIQALSNKTVSNQQIIDAWNALLLDFPPERIALLQQLKKKYRIFLLSNTNGLHHAAFQQNLFAATGQKLEDLFEKTYFSHTVRLRKPDRAIYQLLIDENQLNPAETLFIDDSKANFSGAIEAGLQWYHLQSPETILDIPLFRHL